MLKRFYFLAPFLMIIVLSSCRDAKDIDEFEQDRIYTKYEMVYNAEDDQTIVKAKFRHNSSVGRQIKLTGGSNVRFNNMLLPEITESVSNATYYEMAIAGLVELGTFTWTDADGRVYNNEVTMKIAAIPSDLNEINSSNTFEFYWIGAPVGEDDVVELKINYSGTGSHDYSESDEGSESIYIPASDLQEASPGIASFTTERNQTPPLVDRTSAGGRIEIEYHSAVKSVNILE